MKLRLYTKCYLYLWNMCLCCVCLIRIVFVPFCLLFVVSSLNICSRRHYSMWPWVPSWCFKLLTQHHGAGGPSTNQDPSFRIDPVQSLQNMKPDSDNTTSAAHELGSYFLGCNAAGVQYSQAGINWQNQELSRMNRIEQNRTRQEAGLFLVFDLCLSGLSKIPHSTGFPD